MKSNPSAVGVEAHLASFASFLQAGLPPEERADVGLQAALRSRFSLTSHDGTKKLYAFDYRLDAPRHAPEICRLCGLTYSALVRVVVRLVFWERDEDSGALELTDLYEQEVYFVELPLMTEHGTFIIDGEERMFCHQLRPRPGVWFLADGPGSASHAAYLIPARGARLQLFFGPRDVLYASINGKKRFSASLLLGALGATEDELLEALPGLRSTLQAHPLPAPEDATLAIFRHHHKQPPKEHALGQLQKLYRASDDELQVLYQACYPEGESDVARTYVDGLFFAPDECDLTSTGRAQIHERLELSPLEEPQREGVWGEQPAAAYPLTREDVLATIGYLDGLRQGKAGYVCDDPNDLANQQLWSVGDALVEALHEGLERMAATALRRLFKAGDEAYCMPHDLVRSRPVQSRIDALFRDVAQPLGALNPLAELEHTRRLLIPTPSAIKQKPEPRLIRESHPSHEGRLCPGFLEGHAKDGFLTTTLASGACVTSDGHLDIASGDAGSGNEEFRSLSLAAGLVPLWGAALPGQILRDAELQRRAIPLRKAELPWVRTGQEAQLSRSCRAAIQARSQGTVVWADWYRVIVELDEDTHVTHAKEPKRRQSQTQALSVPRCELYPLLENRYPWRTYCVSQVPMVRTGAQVQPGDILTDGAAIKDGGLALGRNVAVAFVPWGHPAAEEGIVASERLITDDVFTSERSGEPEPQNGGNDVVGLEQMQLLRDPEILAQCVRQKAFSQLARLCEGATFAMRFHFEDRGEACWIEKGSGFSPDLLERLPLQQWPLLIDALSLDLDVADRLSRYCYELEDSSYVMKQVAMGRHEQLNELSASLPALGQRVREPLRVGDTLATRLGDEGRVAAIRAADAMPTFIDGTPVDLIMPVEMDASGQLRRRLEASLGRAAALAGTEVELPAGRWTEEALQGRCQELLAQAKVSQEDATALIAPQSGERWEGDIVAGVVYVMKLEEADPEDDRGL